MIHRPIVFVDVETTGGVADHGRITEIGAIRVENGQITDTFQTLLNPQRLIRSPVSRLTGITNEMVWEAPSFARVAEDLEDFFAGALFAAHNVEFDYGHIKSEFQRIGVNFRMDRFCTVQLSRALYPRQYHHGLDQVIHRMKLHVAHRHRAFDDAEVLLKMFAHEYRYRPYELFRQIDKLLRRVKTNPAHISYQSRLF